MARTAKIVAPEPIANNGWSFYEKCRCSGVTKYKYRNSAFPGLELQWLVKMGHFKIKDKSKTKVGLTKIGQLQEVLSTLVK